MEPVLDDIMWRSLTGPHAHWAVGGGGARRYAPGFSPLLGFADLGNPDFGALADHCAPGEQFYCDGWSGPPPPGWRIEVEAAMFKMLWDAPRPDDPARDAVRLAPAHYPQAFALAQQTRPGPFGIRTPELGEYFGIFEGERLVAMAGERTAATGLREVSGVCTDPAFQGRGLARKLMLKLVHRQLGRGERPFLHVMAANEGAWGLYERMGFRKLKQVVVRVVSMNKEG